MALQILSVLFRPQGRFAGAPRSSTLFGAYCWAIRTLEGISKLDEFLSQASEGHPSVVFSSTFPVLETDEGRTYFLPRPLDRVKAKQAGEFDEQEYKARKKLKSRELVSEKLFNLALNANGVEVSLPNNDRELLLLSVEGVEGYSENRELIHVSIDRLTNSVGEGLLYTEVSHFLSDRFTFHSIVLTEDAELLRAACRYLSDTGIGPDRSTGRGHFEIAVEKCPSSWDWLSPPSEGPCQFVSLSQYLPSKDELGKSPDGCFYNLEPVRSKVDSQCEFKGDDIWKAPMTYATEGSVFRVSETKPFYGWAPKAKELSGSTVLQSGFTVPAFIKGVD